MHRAVCSPSGASHAFVLWLHYTPRCTKRKVVFCCFDGKVGDFCEMPNDAKNLLANFCIVLLLHCIQYKDNLHEMSNTCILLKDESCGLLCFWKKTAHFSFSSLEQSSSVFTPETKRAAAKRFKVTGTGKLKRMKAYKSHILTKKTTKRKRNLRHAAMTDATNVKTMKKIMPYL